MDREGKTARRGARLAAPALLLALLGAAALGGMAEAAGSGTLDKNNNTVNGNYSDNSVNYSSGISSVQRSGQNLVINMGSVDSKYNRTVRNEGTITIPVVYSNQLPTEITYDSSADKYILNATGTVTEGDTGLVNGGTVYAAIHAGGGGQPD